MGGMSVATSEQPVNRRKLLLVLLLPLFVTLVAISVINVALPAIEGSIGASSTALQWLISGYALSFGLMLVPAGRLGDATGRRRMLVVGMALFTIGSLICGLAQDSTVLNAARILQGVGSGFLSPNSMGLLQRHFQGQERARAFAYFGSTVAVATAVGPLFGGVLIDALGPETGWRWVFFVNVPIGLLTIFLAHRWVPDDRVRDTGRLDIDPVGTVLLGVAVLAFMVPFMVRDLGVTIWALLPVSLVLAVAFVQWEHRYKARGRPPMVDMAVLASPPFRNGIVIGTVFFAGITSIWIIIALYLQMHLGHSALETSLVGLPASIAAGISSVYSGRHVLRLGRTLVVAGFATSAVAVLAVAVVARPVESGAISFWWLAAPLALTGVAQGMTITPNQTLTLRAVDPRFGGVAGGLLSLGQRIGTAVGTALIPGVVFVLTENGTAWVDALGTGFVLIAAFSLIALVFCLHDRKRERAESTADV